MVPDAPPEGGRTTTTPQTRLLPLLYLPRELPEGFRQAIEWEERLSEAVKRAASARDLVCQRISLMKGGRERALIARLGEPVLRGRAMWLSNEGAARQRLPGSRLSQVVDRMEIGPNSSG